MDRLTSILLFGGLGCFILAFLLSGLYPWLITDAKQHEATILEVANPVTDEVKDLKDRYPMAFKMAYPDADKALTERELTMAGIPRGDARREANEKEWVKAHATLLERGRNRYIAEACWHCHSQYVRPVANEALRYGPIRSTQDDNNALQRPVLWGTRRVGPDLTNEGGRRSNDWHLAHFWNPKTTSPGSVMPRFTWYFRDGYQIRRTIDEDTADREGISEKNSYPYPGIYENLKDAEKVIADLQENPPANLEDEVERLFVEKARGPDADMVSLIAYLQWLGRWHRPVSEEASK